MKMPAKFPIFRLVKPRLPNVRSSVTLMIAAFIVLSLIWLWVWGSEWKIGDYAPFASITKRLLITAVYALTVGIWVVWLMVQKIRQYEKARQETKEEIKDPVSTHVLLQQRYLQHWLIKLQRHFKQSRSAVYQVPWYLMLGDKGSGKTTLLNESIKLTRLYEVEETDDTDEHLYLECLLSDRAAIFDVRGELINQNDSPEDKPKLYSRLWTSLLEWLATERTRQPLNGIILTIDIHKFILSSKQQRETYIATLNQRLTDIVNTRQNRVPLYLIFTKLDLFYGFESIYQSLSKEERDTILGVTFTLNDEQSWEAELARFWQNWIQRINSAMPDMMLNNVDSHQRSSLFTFSRQMVGMEEFAKNLIESLLFNIDKNSLLLRGLYLTSSTQKGQMDDLFVKSAAAQYQLSRQPYPTWQTAQTVPYFTRNLFSQVLFSEPNLAGENEHYTRLARRRMTIFGSGAALLTLCLIGSWQYYYIQNYRAGEDVLKQAKAFMEIEQSTGKDLYGNLQLPLLNPLSEAMFAYGNYHDRNRFIADFGLYQGYNIGPNIEKTYLRLLQEKYLPAIMDGLFTELNAAPKESEQKLGILRIIRMIEDESGRNNALVLSYMQNRWSNEFKGQRALQDQLYDHLGYAMDHVQWYQSRQNGNAGALEAFSPYKTPIKEAQKELSKLSIYQRVYQNLRIKASDVLPNDLNLKTQIGSSFDTIFVANNEKLLNIPKFLTHSGLLNYFLKQNDHLIELTSMDSWVLNITQNVEYSDADRAEIKRQISELYVSDYVSTWHGAVANLSIKQFSDIPEAISALENVIGGEQPLKKALIALQENTQGMNPPTEKELATATVSAKDRLMINRIHREFTKETSVLDETNNQESAIQNATQKLGDLHRYLLAIQNSPSPGKAALKAVQLRLNNNGSDPIFEVQQLAKTLPEPLGRWLNELATQVWDVVVREAIQSLEVEWNEKVVSEYKLNLAGRYPFSKESMKDVPLSEFDRFFKPGGTVDSFYQENLKVFVENNLLQGADNQSLIRSDVLNQLKNIEKIRRTFFNPQNGLGIQYAIEPVEMSGNKRRSVLNLDGQLLEYSHGRGNKVRMIWPNTMRDNVESRITLMSSASLTQRGISRSGIWAQLRLLDAGQLSNITENTFDVRYTVDGGYMVYRVYVDSADNPFAGGLFSQFRLSETLY
ncbi:type VI secretion system membrane subunit TssM [Budvicia aquatica]|nr:type VI secretion system membrane subunit TssM [Budvicia aquatica]